MIKFRRYFWLFCYSVVFVALSGNVFSAMAQVSRPVQLQDILNVGNTPVLQSIAQCLPSSHVISQYGILSFADTSIATPSGNIEVRYFYIYVDTSVSNQDDAPEPWYTVIAQDLSSGACQNYRPEQELVTLTRILPLEVATQFAEAQYHHLRATNPEEYQGLVHFVETGEEVESSDMPMDEIIGGCQLFPEEINALRRMGIQVSSVCRAVDVPEEIY